MKKILILILLLSYGLSFGQNNTGTLKTGKLQLDIPDRTINTLTQVVVRDSITRVTKIMSRNDFFKGIVTPTYSKVVYVNNTSPTIATIFDDENPPVVNDNSLKTDTHNLYIGNDESTWVYKTSPAGYVTKVVPANSNFYFTGTTVDAANSKASNISRNGNIHTYGAFKTPLGFFVNRDGLDTSFVGSGFFGLYNNAITDGNSFQLNTSNGIDIWNYTSGISTKRFTFSSEGNFTANSFIKSGGTSSQFLMADGSVTSSNSAIVALDEGNGVGYVLAGRNPDNYAEIGFGAVDFSFANEGGGASGANSVVSGGGNNYGFGAASTISGGVFNSALALGSVVSGGQANAANSEFSTVSGGAGNTAGVPILPNSGSSSYATVSGGGGNNAPFAYSTVSGGQNNTAQSYGEWVGGLRGTMYTPFSPNGWDARDRIFNIGNAQYANSDAFTILKSGLATLPSVTNTLISEEPTGKAIVTKEYLENTIANLPPSQSTNSPDAILLSRANHTGTQPSSTISDFNTATDARIVSGITGKENTIASGTNSQYYRGDKTFQTLDKTSVGLSNVDNTSDVNKPISVNTQAGLDVKADLEVTESFYIPTGYNFNSASSITQNKIIITKDFDLGGSTVNFGSNKNIIFRGGSFTNGTIQGTNCRITADKVELFKNASISFTGTWKNDFYPEWWANASTSNYQVALQKAIDGAALSSGKVVLSSYTYTYYDQLTLKEGVNIEGVSKGNTALGSGPTKGSVLWCLGSSLGSTTYDNIAIKIIGKMVGLRNFTIKGERSLSKKGSGIQLYGVGDGVSSTALLEGINLSNILIHGFEKGKGLHLVAGNSGAVTYSTFNDIRIRDCAEHLTIESLSSKSSYGNLGSTGLAYTSPTGFLNSNTFAGLYISGYCESGIKVVTQENTLLTNSQIVYTPANNLIFQGVVIEPPFSTNSHIRLEGGGSSVRMHDIRVEALNQNSTNPTVPVIYLGSGVNSCYIDADQCSVPIVDLGYNNDIRSHNTKNGNATPNGQNLYKNSSFSGLDKTGSLVYIPEWKIEEMSTNPADTYFWRSLQTNSAITLNYSTTVEEEGFKVLNITVPPNYQIRISQVLDADAQKITNAKVNCFAKASSLADVIWTYQDSVTPLLSGGTTFGTGAFEQIGAWFPITSSAISSYYRFAIFCQNLTGVNKTFEITKPSFAKGQVTPINPAKPITDNGGVVYGVLGQNVVKNIQPVTNPEHRVAASSADVVLPNEGNFFEINDGNFYIQKINTVTKRFGIGTVITLIFMQDNVSIIDSQYIDLLKPFLANTGYTITLQDVNGSGLWRELYRSEPEQIGFVSAEIGTFVSGTEITLDKFHNIFELSNTPQTTTIFSRVNNATNRFDAGKQITLRFVNPNGTIQITNSGYITLTKTGSYTPNDGDWIKLETKGDGSWYEIARKSSALPELNIGYTTVESSTSTTTNYLTLPTTGENNFLLNNTSAGAVSITRINNITSRFPAGKEILISFGTLTNGISFTNSSYIALTYNRLFIPVSGDWIKFQTKGDGTWFETGRKESNLLKSYRGYTTVESSTATVTNFLTLPTTGENYFLLNNTSGAGVTVSRINNDSAVRFEAGSEILIKFGTLTNAIAISNSSYITLMYTGSYVPVANDWIRLVTDGNGTWTETARKPMTIPPATSGVATLDLASAVATNFLTLSTTGENYFVLNNTGAASTINRINETASLRLVGGKDITLYFNTLTNGVTITNSGYITLLFGVNYIPVTGDWIVLRTSGNGTWIEIDRKPSATPFVQTTAVGTTGNLLLGGATNIGTKLNVTGSSLQNGNNYFSQPTPTALSATATLTISQILTGITTVTSGIAVSLTLPTGTLTDAGILTGLLPVNTAFEWSIINLGSSVGVVTLVEGTGHTIVGNSMIIVGGQGTFRTVKTATNTFITYRVY